MKQGAGLARYTFVQKAFLLCETDNRISPKMAMISALKHGTGGRTMAKRLIDADALIKAHCEGCSHEVQESCKTDPICASMMWIVEAPAVDAVEVVRRRNCKYREDRPLRRVSKIAHKVAIPRRGGKHMNNITIRWQAPWWFGEGAFAT